MSEEVANRFNVRHANAKQQGKYERAIFLPWIFYSHAREPGCSLKRAPREVASDPDRNAQPYRRARHRSGGGSWVFGLILILVGLYFLVREYLPDLNLDRLWPIGLVLVGIVLLFGALRRRPA